jgi:hypothetical protein
MNRAMIGVAVASLALLTAACSSAPAGPSPAAKRVEARQNAFDHAHPGLVNCQVTVLGLLQKTVTAMQAGYGGGIDINQVMAQYGDQSAVFQAFSELDGQVIAYVDEHGPAGSVGSVYGQARSLCAQYGASPALPPNVTPSASAPASQPAASYPTPTPEHIGPPGCPGSAQLMAAWNAAPAGARQTRLTVSGFNDISCWQGWVVASPIMNANGLVVFSRHNGLHLLPSTELQQFSSAVCSSPDSPAAWKNPADGPATCSS